MPVDGEFLVEETCGVAKGVGGGNLIIRLSLNAALAISKTSSECDCSSSGCCHALPGGVVRSGSKVGSRYAALKTTNDAFCRASRKEPTQLYSGVTACLEIVIDGE